MSILGVGVEGGNNHTKESMSIQNRHPAVGQMFGIHCCLNPRVLNQCTQEGDYSYKLVCAMIECIMCVPGKLLTQETWPIAGKNA